MNKHINPAELVELINTQTVHVVDIRDVNSFNDGHIKNAKMLDNQNVTQFIASTDKAETVVVCCYHGNSSKGAAQFLAEQGFEHVYSLDGGYEMFKVVQPQLTQPLQL